MFEAFSVLIHRSPEPFVPTRSTGHRFKIGELHSPWKGLAAYKGSEPLKEPVVHHKLSVTILDVCAYTHTHIYIYICMYISTLDLQNAGPNVVFCF